MDEKDFEKVVKKGIDSVPPEFREKLENVAIVIEDTPSEEQVKKFHLGHGFTLYGLYEGVPRTVGEGILPAKITIFRLPIEHGAKDEEDMREIVKHTVWHEIAHYFGMNEDHVRESERVRISRTTKK